MRVERNRSESRCFRARISLDLQHLVVPAIKEISTRVIVRMERDARRGASIERIRYSPNDQFRVLSNTGDQSLAPTLFRLLRDCHIRHSSLVTFQQQSRAGNSIDHPNLALLRRIADPLLPRSASMARGESDVVFEQSDRSDFEGSG